MTRSFDRRRKALATIPITLGLVLAACASHPAGADANPVDGSADQNIQAPGDASPQTGPTIPVDAQGCMDLSALHSEPIRLTGRLVVTYSDPALEAKMCDYDEESKKYWCPTATPNSEECADVSGVHWCPVDGTPADRIGDPQELGSFDLANPGAGVKRWTNNLVHEAELDISPDGRKVVYAVREKMDAFEDGLGIWVSNSDGSDPRKVVDRKGHTGIPTWVPPSNDKFTFIADGLHVFDMSTNTTTDVKIANFDSGLVIDPEASYDGKRMTFKADASGGNAPAIYVMDFDGRAGSNVKQLTRGFSDHDPVFSRDNKKVYFERYYGPGDWDNYEDRLANPEVNQWGIVEVDPASGTERVLIPHDKCGKHFFWLPTVSPDGKHIMFIHDYVAEDGYQDLWVSDVDGRNAQPVPSTKGFHWFDWSE